jgi:nucleotide-binding universal stress UspA family protein
MAVGEPPPADTRTASRSTSPSRQENIMTIAVAHSDSDRGKAALRHAAEEAVLRSQPLAVLQIVPGVDEVTTEDPALNERIAAELLDYTDLSWKVYTAPEGFDTAEALLDLAEEVDATLLVIGSRKRTRVGKLFLGSVVQRVLLEAEIPVLVVKAA